MGLKKYHAVLISSNDFWSFDPESYDSTTKLYGDFTVIKGSSKTEDSDMKQCSYFFEIGNQDNHGFKPISIKYDEAEGFLMIEGEQQPMGKNKKRVFQIGEEARRYKNMRGPRHSVDVIVVSRDSKKQEIKDYLKQQQDDSKGAESFSADTLNQINPIFVEGAEDVMGAESNDRMGELERKAKKLYLDEIDEAYIKEVCDEYDLDYHNEKDYAKACSKYLDQIDYIHILDMLDSDDLKELKQLYKDNNISYHKQMGAESETFCADCGGRRKYNAESFDAESSCGCGDEMALEAEDNEEPETITHVVVFNEDRSGSSIRKKIRDAFDKVGYHISPVPKKMKGLTYVKSNSNPVETFIYNEHIDEFRKALEEQGLDPLFAEVFNSYWDIPDEIMKHYNKVGWPAPYSEEGPPYEEYHDAEEWDFGNDREALINSDENSDFNTAWRMVFRTKRIDWPSWGQKFYDKYKWTLDDSTWNPYAKGGDFEDEEEPKGFRDAEAFDSEGVIEAVQQNLNDNDFVNYAYKVLIGGDAKTFEEKSMAIAETMNQNANNEDFTSFVEDSLFKDAEGDEISCSCQSPIVRHAGVHPRTCEACDLIVDAEDVVELVQEVSPFPMGKLFASFIVVGISAIAGAQYHKKLLNR
jgi:hypothetical protein